MSDADLPVPPREPEIELLGKLARGGLRALRIAFWLAGLAALGYGAWKSLLAEPRPDAPTPWPSASGAVWIVLALPLLLPADWLLSRGRARWLLLLISAALWFLPMLLADDSAYGYILRIFATLVAFLCLVVWRTLWRLGDSASPPPA